MISMRKREIRIALLFITPYLIGYILFHFLPILMSFILSLSDVRYISRIGESSFIGLANYIEMFHDSEFLNALRNSVLYSLMYVPLVMLTGLILAILVNQRLYARNLIRSMLFMPYVSNMVAIAVVWGLLMDPGSGVINNVLRSIGIENPPMWLMSTRTSLISVVIIAVWQGVGLQFVTFLAAFQNVPSELKEAAYIDGTSRFQNFIHVTLPCISSQTFLLIITSIITSLKNYTIVQVLTDGGPGTSSTILPLNIVNTAFTSFRMGYACAQTVVMFLIVMLVTLVQWRGRRRFELD